MRPARYLISPHVAHTAFEFETPASQPLIDHIAFVVGKLCPNDNKLIN